MELQTHTPFISHNELILLVGCRPHSVGLSIDLWRWRHLIGNNDYVIESNMVLAGRPSVVPPTVSTNIQEIIFQFRVLSCYVVGIVRFKRARDLL